MNLFEMMQKAGAGDGFGAFARQFGLSEEQVSGAFAAFLPAFSAGLKRKAADPLSAFDFMRELAGHQYETFFRRPASAFDATEGPRVLEMLFGSAEVSRAIAEQASAATGIAQKTLSEMLPAFAATLFGGLQQQAAGNPLFDALLKQFSARGAGPAAAPRKAGAKGPLDRLEEEQAAAERSKDAEAFARVGAEGMKSAFSAMAAGGAAWGEMMRKMVGPGGAAAGQNDPFRDLFEHGTRLGEAYQRNIEAIFQRAQPPKKRN